ncbi:MAG: winged helix DNA-binding domain-containing protein [Anaerolineae bacterium]
MDIVAHRLHSQQLLGTQFRTPAEVVDWFGAVQAQDYPGGKWAIGLRLPGATDADIERAIADRSIIRTWPMRGTLHFVAAEDIRWMLEALTPRVVAGASSRHRQLELDDATFARSREVIAAALQGGKRLSRPAMYQTLDAAGISTQGQRGIHILGRLAQEGLICFGPHEGKQPAFVLLDEWAPNAKRLERDVALAELARRYFTSHGPATVQDFVWWSGLTAADARAGLDAVKSALVEERVDGQSYWLRPDITGGMPPAPLVHLLPAFDEYMVAYRDRGAALRAVQARDIPTPGMIILGPIIVADGQFVGAWKRRLGKGSVSVAAQPLLPLTDAETHALAEAARRYGDFVGLPAHLS